jgi:hypothetical protein
MYNIYLVIDIFNDSRQDGFEVRETNNILIDSVDDGFENLMNGISKIMGNISIKGFTDIYNTIEKYGSWCNSSTQTSSNIRDTHNTIYINNNLRIEKE